MDNQNEKDKRRKATKMSYSAKSMGKIKRLAPGEKKKNDEKTHGAKSKNMLVRWDLKNDKANANFEPQKKKTSEKLPQKKNPVRSETKRERISQNGEKTENGDNLRKFSVILGGKNPKIRIKKMILTAICAVLVLSVAIFTLTRPTGIGEWFKTKLASSTVGGGFPVSINETSAKRIFSFNNEIIMLSDTDLRCYNNTGGMIFSRLHGFNNPVCRTSKMRLLTFNRGGKQYRIDSAADTLKTQKCDSNIIDADIADNGNYVIANDTDKIAKEAAKIYVYNRSFENVYLVRSADKQAYRVAISSDGGKIAVCTVNADEAVLDFEITVYSIKKEEPVCKMTLRDETVYDMCFNGSNLNVLTDKNLCSFNSNGDEKKFSFESRALVKYDFLADGNTLICLAGALNSANNGIYVVKSDMTASNSFDMNFTVNDLKAAYGKIYVLSNRLLTYSYDGEKISETDIQTGAAEMCNAFGKMAVLYPTSIALY